MLSPGTKAVLTAREAQVHFELVTTAGTFKAIAQHLGVSGKTIGTHAENIYRKLGIGRDSALTNRRAALIQAYYSNILANGARHQGAPVDHSEGRETEHSSATAQRAVATGSSQTVASAGAASTPPGRAGAISQERGA